MFKILFLFFLLKSIFILDVYSQNNLENGFNEMKKVISLLQSQINHLRKKEGLSKVGEIIQRRRRKDGFRMLLEGQ